MWVPRHLVHFLLFLLVAAVVLHYAPRYISSQASETYIGKVVGITDGDTLTLLVDRREVKMRLAEIDTPERGQPFGTRAKQALSDLAYGKEARVVVVDVDRYGRTVGRVYVDGRDVNAELVRQGYAWVYRKYAEDPKLYELEEKARKAGRGLWAHPGPVPPWEWRRGVRNLGRTVSRSLNLVRAGLSDFHEGTGV